MKRKRNVGLSAESDSKRHALNPLSDITNRGPGRPRQKRLRKKPFQFPRQVSSQVKPKMLKAASLVQRGACMYKVCIFDYEGQHVHVIVTIHIAKQVVSTPNLNRISAKELLEVIYKLLCSAAMYMYINFGAGNNQTIP